MLEKIGSEKFRTVSTPSQHVIAVLDRLVEKEKRKLSIAEIGVGIGATTQEICKRLRKDDELYLFDYEDKVNELAQDLSCFDCKIIGKGNSKKLFDSYSWHLGKLYLSISNKDLFDMVYLDGAHIFIHDAPALCIIKEMCKLGGYVILDDVNWTYLKSPTVNPQKKPVVKERLTDEQISTPHIDFIIKLFLQTDRRYKKVQIGKLPGNRAIFQRVE